MEHQKKIFISHRTTDANIADMVRDFFVGLGVSFESIFCSSLPGNDVKENISKEVKASLQSSSINVVILSKSYYESAYCLNEAGILWYNDTKVLPIALDEIQPSDMIGFLNDEYKLRRLNSDEDIAYIADLLIEEGVLTSVKSAMVITQSRKLKERYESVPRLSNPSKNNNKLVLCGIKEDGKLSDTANFQKLKLNCDKSVDGIVSKIKKLYEEISKIHISDIAPVLKGLRLESPITIHDGIKTTINDMADYLGFELPKDFFFVGSLSKPFNALPNFFGEEDLNGSDEEIKKYKLINELYLSIDDFYGWAPIEDGFKDINCVRLALSNKGFEPDEDIDVSIRIPKDSYMTVEEFPEFDEETMKYLVDECNMSSLLEILGTAEYMEYNSTIKNHERSTYSSNFTINPFIGKDYEEDYLEDIKDALCCEIYPYENDYIVKVNFEYLKHNTTAAFPTAIILKKKIDVISYEITSQKSTEIIKGTISVE